MSTTTELDDAARELRLALSTTPRTIPPRWLYDDRGSDLFTEITALPEYYPTEAERSIFEENATLIAELTDAHTVIELGSGTSDKTRTLLDALVAHGTIERFAPLDVSEATLTAAAEALRERYPTLVVEPVVGDFTRHLHHLPNGGGRLVAFLGGTIGNFYVEQRRAFLGALADVLDPGDWLLLGVDLVKPIERLIEAYDDPHGITEAFIRNALTHINHVYDGNIDVGTFGYVPFWDGRQERIDMRLRASEPSSARLVKLDLDLEIAAGEELRIEISTKFRIDRLHDELCEAGFCGDDGGFHVFTDDGADFAVVLTRRS
jgi:L-histidine N-alpha-methyltransferase